MNSRRYLVAPCAALALGLARAMCLALAMNTVSHAATLDLSAYRGKVVYLDFWASWCGPCKQSFPWLDQLAREYESKKFVVIGVNLDKDRDKARQFLELSPVGFQIVYDPLGEVATTYKIKGMPSGVLIDRSGHVRYQHIGFSDKEGRVYEDQVQQLLSERAN